MYLLKFSVAQLLVNSLYFKVSLVRISDDYFSILPKGPKFIIFVKIFSTMYNCDIWSSMKNGSKVCHLDANVDFDTRMDSFQF